jgi:hypothetical protein
MAGDTEAAWQLGVGAELASLELEYFAAAIAAEVMMMGLAGDLIPERFARHGNRCKPIALNQRTDIAIYGSDTQTFDLSLRRVQYLFRRKRTVGLLKCLSNC